jgi:hypothetical protein
MTGDSGEYHGRTQTQADPGCLGPLGGRAVTIIINSVCMLFACVCGGGEHN